MAVAILTAGFLLALSLVLLTVGRLRPRKFKIKATLTKWVTLDLEMESPEPSGRLWTARQTRVRSRPHTADQAGRREGRRVPSLLPQSTTGNEGRPSTSIESLADERGNPEHEP